MTENELESILEKGLDAAVDIVTGEMDVQKTDADYEERRRYARERLIEYIFFEEVVGHDR